MGNEMPPLSEEPLGTNPGTTSAKKIEANRQNAQSSTGPKTVEGKKTVSCNARKHGLLAKEIVITTGDGKEDQAEFDVMLAELRDTYHPIGIAEDLLVQELAISYWRSARALRCERGQLTSYPTTGEVQPLSELEKLLRDSKNDEEVRYELLGNSGGLQYVIQKVQEARKEVEHSRALSWETSKWLSRHIGGSWNGMVNKQALLTSLDEKTTELITRKMMLEEIELRRENVNQDRRAIPTMEQLTRITRYETTNVRHRERVMQMLERSQLRRRQNPGVIPGAGDDGEGSPNS
jgi:hypothetical protein